MTCCRTALVHRVVSGPLSWIRVVRSLVGVVLVPWPVAWTSGALSRSTGLIPLCRVIKVSPVVVQRVGGMRTLNWWLLR